MSGHVTAASLRAMKTRDPTEKRVAKELTRPQPVRTL